MLFIGNQWQYLKLKSVEMQEAAEILEGDTPSAHLTGPDLSVYQPWHQVWIVIIMKTFWGQKRLGKDLKPKAECKKKAKTNTSEKEQKEKAKFLMKKHKRKGQNGQFMVCAIHDNATGKQVAQLSSNTQAECESIVNKLVSELNQGKKTLDDVKVDLNTYKGA